MLVRVKGKGLKLNKQWHYKGAEVEIEEAEYEKNKEHLDILKEDENTPQIPQVPGLEDKDDEEIELQELRKKGKELGIKNAHLMGKEKLEQAIAEKEAPMFGEKTEETEESSENTESNNEGEKTEEENTAE